jgi:hypothetical protein
MADDAGKTLYVCRICLMQGGHLLVFTKCYLPLIPVLHMGGQKLLLIQVKQRKAKGPIIQYESNQDALGFFPRAYR